VWQECRREAISLRLSVLCDGDRRVKQKIKLKSQIPNRLSRHLSVHEGWESKLSGDEARATMDNKLRGEMTRFSIGYSPNRCIVWYDTIRVSYLRHATILLIRYSFDTQSRYASLTCRLVQYCMICIVNRTILKSLGET
jgi:hypothetical protein